MPQQNSELSAIKKILSDNIGKNFVQRVVYPDQSPTLDNNDGTMSTHSMAWGEDENGKAYVYPTVIQSGNGLIRLNDQEAWNHANKTGEIIPFESKAKAAWFSKHYKKVWEQN